MDRTELKTRRPLVVTIVTTIAVLLIVATRSGQEQRELTVKLDPKSVFYKLRQTEIAKLRFAAFGTSRTWGTGLDNRETQTYDRILSPTSTNFGVRGGREDYPSLCLSSMIGDDVYDVIIVEYDSYVYLRRLIKRLRTRFPHAALIFLEIVPINFYRYLPTNQQPQEIIDAHGFDSLHDPEFHKYMMEHTKASDWGHNFRTDVRDKVIQDYNVWLVKWLDRYDDVRDYIIHDSKYFSDTTHPSVAGHEDIAATILDHLTNLDHVHRNPSNSVGEWVGGIDHCVSWYEDGDLKDVIAKGVEMTSWADGNKHALEVSPTGSSIQFHSPMDGGQIFLNHMVMGPDRGHFPKVRVELPAGDQEAVVIDPFLPLPYHVTKTTNLVGIAKKGTNVIRILPLEQNTEHPYRITGIVVTDSGFVPTQVN